MTGEIKVTFAAVDQAAADIDSAQGRITGQLDELKRHLAPVVSSWTGDAATRYNETQQRWDTSAADLTETLRRIRALVLEAGAGYRAVEASNARRFTS